MFDHVLAYPVLLPLLLASCAFIYQSTVPHLERRAIKKLGSFAPRVRNWLPFGIDLVIRSILHAREDTVLEFWDWIFKFTPTRLCCTAEFYVAQQRVIFTADPENIKAVLAVSVPITYFEIDSVYGVGRGFGVDCQCWRGYVNARIVVLERNR